MRRHGGQLLPKTPGIEVINVFLRGKGKTP